MRDLPHSSDGVACESQARGLPPHDDLTAAHVRGGDGYRLRQMAQCTLWERAGRTGTRASRRQRGMVRCQSTSQEPSGYMICLETRSVLVPSPILWQHQHSDLFTVNDGGAVRQGLCR